MLKSQVESIVKSKGKGQFTNISWGKELKTLKGIDDKVEKIAKAVVRFGVEYDNIQDVKAMRENGQLPSENQGLPWGVWSDYPYFVENKGKDYLRCSTVNNTKIQVQYYKNGKPISRQDAEQICLKSEFNKASGAMEIFTVSVDNIIEIK